MQYVIAFMALLLCIDILSRWYASREVDYIEGSELPMRWVCWGTCRAIGGDGPDFRYFLLRLPSYECAPMFDGSDGVVMMQRGILVFNGKPFTTMLYPLPSSMRFA